MASAVLASRTTLWLAATAGCKTESWHREPQSGRTGHARVGERGNGGGGGQLARQAGIHRISRTLNFHPVGFHGLLKNCPVGTLSTMQAARLGTPPAAARAIPPRAVLVQGELPSRGLPPATSSQTARTSATQVCGSSRAANACQRQREQRTQPPHRGGWARVCGSVGSTPPPAPVPPHGRMALS